MKKFPLEFEDILNRNGKKLLNGQAMQDSFRFKSRTPIAVFNNIIDPKSSFQIIKLLDKFFYDKLKKIFSPIDPDELRKMKKNYSERLSKNLRFKTAELDNAKSVTYETAHKTGLLQLLNSDSFKVFGEKVTGKKFGIGENNQIICYEQGDYVSPHNDHHPENENVRNGYYDIHIMFSNSQVKHQLLVCENKRYLNEYYDISVPAAVAVYRLPFWHYTTPLISKKGNERLARRWLLLSSYEEEKKGLRKK